MHYSFNFLLSKYIAPEIAKHISEDNKFIKRSLPSRLYKEKAVKEMPIKIKKEKEVKSKSDKSF